MGYTFEQIFTHLTPFGFEVAFHVSHSSIGVYRDGKLSRRFDLIKIGTNKKLMVEKSNFNHWLKFMGLDLID